MVARVIITHRDVDALAALLKARNLPVTVSIMAGKPRSDDQNRLQRLWCREVAEQLGDMTPEEVRGYGKLHFGVPILRAENEKFAAAYDENVKPLPYETKLKIMMEPLDLPVTRLMTTKQKTAFLDACFSHWSGLGVRLTLPEAA